MTHFCCTFSPKQKLNARPKLTRFCVWLWFCFLFCAAGNTSVQTSAAQNKIKKKMFLKQMTNKNNGNPGGTCFDLLFWDIPHLHVLDKRTISRKGPANTTGRSCSIQVFRSEPPPPKINKNKQKKWIEQNRTEKQNEFELFTPKKQNRSERKKNWCFLKFAWTLIRRVRIKCDPPVSHKQHNARGDSLVISPTYANGTLILQKNVSEAWDQPLRKWRPEEEILTFMHICKSGGTSLKSLLLNSMLNGTQCRMKCVRSIPELMKAQRNRKCPRLVCDKHFDWSLVAEGEQSGFKMAPVVMFRDPVARAISQFYYHKKVIGLRGIKATNQTLSEHLSGLRAQIDQPPLGPRTLCYPPAWRDGMVNWSYFVLCLLENVSGGAWFHPRGQHAQMWGGKQKEVGFHKKSWSWLSSDRERKSRVRKKEK